MGLRLFFPMLIDIYHAALIPWEITPLDQIFWHRKHCMMLLGRQ